ncbi:hypothetical protein ACFXPX_26975 [Kitasatospora sp. NPDC059146]|uniref:hypothetical protein n=1 Tax=Kitasatospora sp. NPDC059146 TaxID=3346741 RepID=UPI0036B66BCA
MTRVLMRHVQRATACLAVTLLATGTLAAAPAAAAPGGDSGILYKACGGAEPDRYDDIPLRNTVSYVSLHSYSQMILLSYGCSAPGGPSAD